MGDVIDVGIEIVPMKALHDEMSSGVPWYEGELYNLIREGRGNRRTALLHCHIAVAAARIDHTRLTWLSLQPASFAVSAMLRPLLRSAMMRSCMSASC